MWLLVLQWTEWKEERGGGGVYIEEEEEGERVEFSNIWNQSVCKRRGEPGGWIWGEGRRREKEREKKEQMRWKIRPETDTHRRRRRNVGNKTAKAKKGGRNIKQWNICEMETMSHEWRMPCDLYFLKGWGRGFGVWTWYLVFRHSCLPTLALMHTRTRTLPLRHGFALKYLTCLVYL